MNSDFKIIGTIYKCRDLSLFFKKNVDVRGLRFDPHSHLRVNILKREEVGKRRGASIKFKTSSYKER